MFPWVSTEAAGVDFARHARGRLGKDEGTVPLVLKWRWGGGRRILCPLLQSQRMVWS